MSKHRNIPAILQGKLAEVKKIQDALENPQKIIEFNDKLKYDLANTLKESRDQLNMLAVFEQISQNHEELTGQIGVVQNAQENLDKITQYVTSLKNDPKTTEADKLVISQIITDTKTTTALVPAAIAKLPKSEEVDKIMTEATEVHDAMARYYAIRQNIQQEWEVAEASRQNIVAKKERKAERGVVENIFHFVTKRAQEAASAASTSVSSRLTRSQAASSAAASSEEASSPSAASNDDSTREVTSAPKELKTLEDGRALRAHVFAEYKDKFLNALLHCDEDKRLEICSMLTDGRYNDVPLMIDRTILENPAAQQKGDGLSYNEFQTLNMMADHSLNAHVDRFLEERGIDITPQLNQKDMMQKAISLPPGLTIPEVVHALRKKAEEITMLAKDDLDRSDLDDKSLAQKSEVAFKFSEPSRWFDSDGEKLFQDALAIGGTVDPSSKEVTGGLASELSARMVAATEVIKNMNQLTTDLLDGDIETFNQLQIRKSKVTADEAEKVFADGQAIGAAFDIVAEIASTMLDREDLAVNTIKEMSKARNEALSSIREQEAAAQKLAADKEAAAQQQAYEQSLRGRASRFGGEVLQRFRSTPKPSASTASPSAAASEPVSAGPSALGDDEAPVTDVKKTSLFGRLDNFVTGTAQGASGAASNVANVTSRVASAVSSSVGGVVEGAQKFREMTNAEKRETVLGNVKSVGRGAGRILGNVFGEGARLVGAAGRLFWNTAADRINAAQEVIEDAKDTVEQKLDKNPKLKEKTSQLAAAAAAAGEAVVSAAASAGSAVTSTAGDILTSRPALKAAEMAGEGFIVLNDAKGRIQEAAVQAIDNNPTLERAGAAIGRGAKTAVAAAATATAPFIDPLASGGAALGSGLAGGLNQARLDQQAGGYGTVAIAEQTVGAAKSAASTIASYIPLGGAAGAQSSAPVAADRTPSAKGGASANIGKKR